MGNKKKIYFRADAGNSIGYGHFIRTLALAEILKTDFDCTFFTVSPTEYQIGEMEKVCSYVSLCNINPLSIFLEILKGDEIVVLDNYFYTSEYQRLIKDKGCKLVCIDDMHDKHYLADVVINHEITDVSLFSVESYTELALGLDYALLRSPFRETIDELSNERDGSIIISFGGTDPLNLTDKFVSMLRQLNTQREIKIIIGDSIFISEENLSFATVFKRLSAEQMSYQFRKSSLGIFAASTVCIEALFSHLPSCVGFYVDNQLPSYDIYCRDRTIVPLGFLPDVSPNKLMEAINDIGSVRLSSYNGAKIQKSYLTLFKQL